LGIAGHLRQENAKIRQGAFGDFCKKRGWFHETIQEIPATTVDKCLLTAVVNTFGMFISEYS